MIISELMIGLMILSRYYDDGTNQMVSTHAGVLTTIHPIALPPTDSPINERDLRVLGEQGWAQKDAPGLSHVVDDYDIGVGWEYFD